MELLPSSPSGTDERLDLPPSIVDLLTRTLLTSDMITAVLSAYAEGAGHTGGQFRLEITGARLIPQALDD